MLRILKNTVHRLREKSNLLAYTRNNSYQVTFRVELKNTSPKTQQGALIIPMPLKTSYQTIQKSPSFLPAAEQKIEARFQNPYAIWNFKVEPDQELVFEEFFEVLVRPIFVDLATKFNISEYKNCSKKTVELFLQPNAHFQPDDPQLQDLAHDLKGDEVDVLAIIKRLNEHVRNFLHYGNAIPGLYSAQQAYQKKQVDCGGFATLLGSLCMALGIPARLVSGFWAGYPVNTMHAWLEIMLPNGTWLPADPSIEQLFGEGKTRKSGRLGFIGSDRIALSLGCDLTLDIDNQKMHTDILQTPLIYLSTGSSTGPSTGSSTGASIGIQLESQFLTLSA